MKNGRERERVIERVCANEREGKRKNEEKSNEMRQ